MEGREEANREATGQEVAKTEGNVDDEEDLTSGLSRVSLAESPTIMTWDTADLGILRGIFADADLIALDLEGVDLGRFGRTSIVQIATVKKCVLLDVLGADKGSPLVAWLREILEDSRVTKIIHDCRMDADALLHEFDIRLTGVHDTSCFHNAITGRVDVNLNDTLTHYRLDKNTNRDGSVYRTNHAFWATRPMTSKMKAWASDDVNSMFQLHAAQRQRAGTGKSAAEARGAEYLEWADAQATTLTVRSPGSFIGRGGSNLRALQNSTRTIIYGRGPRDKCEFAVYYRDEEGLDRVRRAARR
ncbi:hypothetical protein TrRE_jg3296 [Triparma retinervis]|uniref:3'-5' exonuclease domain-containing protein n=1 Tax=Triparma retinervis TaxID=2557542 RepID=A0A9W6ZMW5_9STRA|nr:hypothetical protein TrRE_jg3296 [Triparma retinervis]